MPGRTGPGWFLGLTQNIVSSFTSSFICVSSKRNTMPVFRLHDRKTAWTTAHPNCCRRECMYDCTIVCKHDHTCSECRIGSGVRVSASFPKNAHLVGRLWSGPRLVGRVGSEVRVSDSFHILSCAVRTVMRSGFRDTPLPVWIESRL